MLTWLSRHVFFPLWEVKDGAHRGQYLAELSASQWQTAEALRKQQWEHLREIVRYAGRNCPFYAQRFAAAGIDDNLKDWQDFRRIPLLSKNEIRDNTDALISREFKRSELVEARTGGSTGTALTIFADRRFQELRNSAAMRSDQWAGWEIGMKVAAIWGNPPVADSLKAKLRNLLLDRYIYLDTMDIREASVGRFVEQWRRERPQVLFGHSHSLFILATLLEKLGVSDLRPRGIISTSMQLLDPERQVMERVFGCRVTNRYGCEEVSLIACECERHDGLHLNMDHVAVEFLRDDGSQAEQGDDANIVVTELVNRGMPLIRYRVGDMGVPTDRQCACGRGLPLMSRVTGRRADFLKRRDGSLVAGVSLVERTLTAIAGIEQMQLVQDRLDSIEVRIVRDAQFDEAAERALLGEMQSVFGDDTEIRISMVDALDQTPSGKYRFSICNV
ncbi:MAG: phenylacetate--CoA ligase family protein [Sterolibacteriaceae bacterium]|nr:phenylacetate--CoA ligase family protein [Sterolibacteriaceae bacterium]